MNIANICTLLRLAICPLFLAFYLYPETFGLTATVLPYALIALLGVSELSDGIDGWLARRFNQVTDLGKLMDPMADSIYRTSVYLAFTQAPINLPIWIVFIFIYRDTCVGTLRTICALRGFALAARFSGKMKAILQAVGALAILVLLIPYSMGLMSGEDLTTYSTWIAFSVGLFALISGADYFIANRSYLSKMLVQRTNP